MPRPLFVLAALIACFAVSLVAAPQHAAAQSVPAQSALVTGILPPAGGLAILVTTRAATAVEVVADLDARGCRTGLISLVRDGASLDYTPGAPANVNAPFPAIIDRGVLLARCGPAPAVAPVVVYYRCADAKTFEARVYPVPAQRATLIVEGRTIELVQTISASGIRYTDGTLTYSSKGADAFIEQAGAITYRDCKAQPVVTGSVTYLEKIALPRGAVVTIELQDVSRADAPAIIIVTQRIVTTGEQVPFPVGLVYDPAAINPSFTYVVRASIRVDGALWFTTDQSYPVITRDRPTRADLVLRRVSTP